MSRPSPLLDLADLDFFEGGPEDDADLLTGPAGAISTYIPSWDPAAEWTDADELGRLAESKMIAALQRMVGRIKFDEKKHPRWPKGTPRAGEFMRVGEFFTTPDGRMWQVMNIAGGRVFAADASGKTGQLEDRIFDATSNAVDGPGVGVPDIAVPEKPKKITGGKGPESETSTVVSPYVDAGTHDPSIPIPEGAPESLTPEAWAQFGLEDQLYYRDLMERYGKWQPNVADTMMHAIFSDYDQKTTQVLVDAFNDQYGPGYYGSGHHGGEALPLAKLFNGISQSDIAKLQKATAKYEDAKAALADLTSVIHWDMYNRLAAPDITLFHRGAPNAGFYKSEYISGKTPVYAGWCQSYRFHAWSEPTVLMSPIAIRLLVLSYTTQLPHASVPGEFEVDTGVRMRLDQRSVSFVDHDLGFGSDHDTAAAARQYIESETHNSPAPGSLVKKLRDAWAGIDVSWLPKPKANLQEVGKPAGQKYLPLPESVLQQAADLLKKATYPKVSDTSTADEDKEAATMPATAMGLDVGSIFEGLHGTRYLVIPSTDPSASGGFGYMYWKIIDKNGNYVGDQGTVYEFENSGGNDYHKLVGTIELPKPKPIAGFVPLSQADYSALAHGPVKVCKTLVSGELISESGTAYKVLSPWSEGDTTVELLNLDTGKKFTINPAFEAQTLLPKGDWMPPPDGSGGGMPFAVGKDLFYVHAGEKVPVTFVGISPGNPDLWEVKLSSGLSHSVKLSELLDPDAPPPPKPPWEPKEGDTVLVSHYPQQFVGTIKAIQDDGKLDVSSEWMDVVIDPEEASPLPHLGWQGVTDYQPGDTFAFEGKKFTISSVLQDGTVRAKPTGGKVQKFTPEKMKWQNVVRPSALAMEYKAKAKALLVGDLVTGSDKVVRPYLVVGKDESNVYLRNLDTGAITKSGPNKMWRRLKEPPKPGEESAADPFQWIPTGQITEIGQLAPGDRYQLGGHLWQVLATDANGAQVENMVTKQQTVHVLSLHVMPVVPQGDALSVFSHNDYVHGVLTTLGGLHPGDTFELAGTAVPAGPRKLISNAGDTPAVLNLLTGQVVEMDFEDEVWTLVPKSAATTYDELTPGDGVTMGLLQEGDRFVYNGGLWEVVVHPDDGEQDITVAPVGGDGKAATVQTKLAPSVAVVLHAKSGEHPPIETAKLVAASDLPDASTAGFVAFKSKGGQGQYKNVKLHSLHEGDLFLDKDDKVWSVKVEGPQPIITNGQQLYRASGEDYVRSEHDTKSPLHFIDQSPPAGTILDAAAKNVYDGLIDTPNMTLGELSFHKYDSFATKGGVWQVIDPGGVTAWNVTTGQEVTFLPSTSVDKASPAALPKGDLPPPVEGVTLGKVTGLPDGFKANETKLANFPVGTYYATLGSDTMDYNVARIVGMDGDFPLVDDGTGTHMQNPNYAPEYVLPPSEQQSAPLPEKMPNGFAPGEKIIISPASGEIPDIPFPATVLPAQPGTPSDVVFYLRADGTTGMVKTGENVATMGPDQIPASELKVGEHFSIVGGDPNTVFELAAVAAGSEPGKVLMVKGPGAKKGTDFPWGKPDDPGGVPDVAVTKIPPVPPLEKGAQITPDNVDQVHVGDLIRSTTNADTLYLVSAVEDDQFTFHPVGSTMNYSSQNFLVDTSGAHLVWQSHAPDLPSVDDMGKTLEGLDGGDTATFGPNVVVAKTEKGGYWVKLSVEGSDYVEGYYGDPGNAALAAQIAALTLEPPKGTNWSKSASALPLGPMTNEEALTGPDAIFDVSLKKTPREDLPDYTMVLLPNGKLAYCREVYGKLTFYAFGEGNEVKTKAKAYKVLTLKHSAPQVEMLENTGLKANVAQLPIGALFTYGPNHLSYMLLGRTDEGITGLVLEGDHKGQIAYSYLQPEVNVLRRKPTVALTDMAVGTTFMAPGGAKWKKTGDKTAELLDANNNPNIQIEPGTIADFGPTPTMTVLEVPPGAVTPMPFDYLAIGDHFTAYGGTFVKTSPTQAKLLAKAEGPHEASWDADVGQEIPIPASLGVTPQDTPAPGPIPLGLVSSLPPGFKKNVEGDTLGDLPFGTYYTVILGPDEYEIRKTFGPGAPGSIVYKDATGEHQQLTDFEPPYYFTPPTSTEIKVGDEITAQNVGMVMLGDTLKHASTDVTYTVTKVEDGDFEFKAVGGGGPWKGSHYFDKGLIVWAGHQGGAPGLPEPELTPGPIAVLPPQFENNFAPKKTLDDLPVGAWIAYKDTNGLFVLERIKSKSKADGEVMVDAGGSGVGVNLPLTHEPLWFYVPPEPGAATPPDSPPFGDIEIGTTFEFSGATFVKISDTLAKMLSKPGSYGGFVTNPGEDLSFAPESHVNLSGAAFVPTGMVSSVPPQFTPNDEYPMKAIKDLPVGAYFAFDDAGIEFVKKITVAGNFPKAWDATNGESTPAGSYHPDFFYIPPSAPVGIAAGDHVTPQNMGAISVGDTLKSDVNPNVYNVTKVMPGDFEYEIDGTVFKASNTSTEHLVWVGHPVPYSDIEFGHYFQDDTGSIWQKGGGGKSKLVVKGPKTIFTVGNLYSPFVADSMVTKLDTEYVHGLLAGAASDLKPNTEHLTLGDMNVGDKFDPGSGVVWEITAKNVTDELVQVVDEDGNDDVWATTAQPSLVALRGPSKVFPEDAFPIGDVPEMEVAQGVTLGDLNVGDWFMPGGDEEPWLITKKGTATVTATKWDGTGAGAKFLVGDYPTHVGVKATPQTEHVTLTPPKTAQFSALAPGTYFRDDVLGTIWQKGQGASATLIADPNDSTDIEVGTMTSMYFVSNPPVTPLTPEEAGVGPAPIKVGGVVGKGDVMLGTVQSIDGDHATVHVQNAATASFTGSTATYTLAELTAFPDADSIPEGSYIAPSYDQYDAMGGGAMWLAELPVGSIFMYDWGPATPSNPQPAVGVYRLEDSSGSVTRVDVAGPGANGVAWDAQFPPPTYQFNPHSTLVKLVTSAHGAPNDGDHVQLSALKPGDKFVRPGESEAVTWTVAGTKVNVEDPDSGMVVSAHTQDGWFELLPPDTPVIVKTEPVKVKVGDLPVGTKAKVVPGSASGIEIGQHVGVKGGSVAVEFTSGAEGPVSAETIVFDPQYPEPSPFASWKDVPIGTRVYASEDPSVYAVVIDKTDGWATVANVDGTKGEFELGAEPPGAWAYSLPTLLKVKAKVSVAARTRVKKMLKLKGDPALPDKIESLSNTQLVNAHFASLDTPNATWLSALLMDEIQRRMDQQDKPGGFAVGQQVKVADPSVDPDMNFFVVGWEQDNPATGLITVRDDYDNTFAYIPSELSAVGPVMPATGEQVYVDGTPARASDTLKPLKVGDYVFVGGDSEVTVVGPGDAPGYLRVQSPATGSEDDWALLDVTEYGSTILMDDEEVHTQDTGEAVYLGMTIYAGSNEKKGKIFAAPAGTYTVSVRFENGDEDDVEWDVLYENPPFPPKPEGSVSLPDEEKQAWFDKLNKGDVVQVTPTTGQPQYVGTVKSKTQTSADITDANGIEHYTIFPGELGPPPPGAMKHMPPGGHAAALPGGYLPDEQVITGGYVATVLSYAHVDGELGVEWGDKYEAEGLVPISMITGPDSGTIKAVAPSLLMSADLPGGFKPGQSVVTSAGNHGVVVTYADAQLAGESLPSLVPELVPVKYDDPEKPLLHGKVNGFYPDHLTVVGDDMPGPFKSGDKVITDSGDYGTVVSYAALAAAGEDPHLYANFVPVHYEKGGYGGYYPEHLTLASGGPLSLDELWIGRKIRLALDPETAEAYNGRTEITGTVHAREGDMVQVVEDMYGQAAWFSPDHVTFLPLAEEPEEPTPDTKPLPGDYQPGHYAIAPHGYVKVVSYEDAGGGYESQNLVPVQWVTGPYMGGFAGFKPENLNDFEWAAHFKPGQEVEDGGEVFTIAAPHELNDNDVLHNLENDVVPIKTVNGTIFTAKPSDLTLTPEEEPGPEPLTMAVADLPPGTVFHAYGGTYMKGEDLGAGTYAVTGVGPQDSLNHVYNMTVEVVGPPGGFHPGDTVIAKEGAPLAHGGAGTVLAYADLPPDEDPVGYVQDGYVPVKFPDGYIDGYYPDDLTLANPPAPGPLVPYKSKTHHAKIGSLTPGQPFFDKDKEKYTVVDHVAGQTVYQDAEGTQFSAPADSFVIPVALAPGAVPEDLKITPDEATRLGYQELTVPTGYPSKFGGDGELKYTQLLGLLIGEKFKLPNGAVFTVVFKSAGFVVVRGSDGSLWKFPTDLLVKVQS